MAKVTYTAIKNNELANACKNYKDYANLKKEAEAKIAEIENEIKAYMEENSLEEIAIGDNVITYKEIVRTTVDKDVVREICGDKYDKESSYIRVTVTIA